MSTRAWVAAVAAAACSCAVTAMAIDATDGVMKKDGKMVMVSDGKPTVPMAKDVTLPDSTKVLPDGTIMTKEGDKREVQEGQIIMAGRAQVPQDGGMGPDTGLDKK